MAHRPCPFCGGHELEVSDAYHDNGKEYSRWVWCHGCLAEGPHVENEGDSEAAAWEAWDKRGYAP